MRCEGVGSAASAISASVFDLSKHRLLALLTLNGLALAAAVDYLPVRRWRLLAIRRHAASALLQS